MVWSRTGPWSAPHDPRLVGEDRVLLFDNLGASSPDAPASRLVEFSPSTGEVHWEWRAEPSSAFFSRFCGAAVRLVNGNTLVSETGAGRAFELDPDGQVVWSFSSPHRARPNDRLIAALFELERLPASAAAWLACRAPPSSRCSSVTCRRSTGGRANAARRIRSASPGWPCVASSSTPTSS